VIRIREFWLLQLPGRLLLLYLVDAQGIPAFDYERGVRMGALGPVAAGPCAPPLRRALRVG
jgi:hypothetical protein